MNVRRLAIDELHEFLKSKIMHESDPRRRFIDDAFGTILNKRNEEQIHRLGWWPRRNWPYFAAIAIYSYLSEIHIKFGEVEMRFLECLKEYLPHFPRLAYLNVPLNDPKLKSFDSLIGGLLEVPEYREFWASFGPVEQKALPALDKEELRNAINVEVNAWRSSFESDLKDELRERIKQELKQELREDIRNELKAELKVSIEEELKAEGTGPTVTHQMEQSKCCLCNEKDSNSSSEDSGNGLSMDEPRNESKVVATEGIEELPGDLVSVEKPPNKESAYGLSMDDVRDETKRIVTEAIEELKGDLVSVLESKIKAKIAKSVKNELKDELAEESANDLMDFKRDMKKKQSKMMDTLREQLHEDIKDEIVQMIQQDLKKCLQDLRRTKPN